MALIIEQSEMAELRREFGPNTDEDAAFLIRKGDKKKDGVFDAKSSITEIGPIGCRIIYVGNMTVRERIMLAQVAAEGDYLISLEAGELVYTSDILKVSAMPWSPNKRYVIGRKATAIGDNKVFYMCIQDGLSGITQPNWASLLKDGDRLADGSVIWERRGKALEYQIIQIAGPTTYGDMFSTKLACTLRQDVTPKP